MEYIKMVGETFLILIILTFLLELIGRKSVTHFSIIQVVVFISMGEVVLLPIYDKAFEIMDMVTVVLSLILFLLVVEWLLLKFHFLEPLLNKKAVVIIKDGKMVYDELKKQKLSVDQLEMKLRTKGIKNYEELEVATMEGNGDIGYKYKPEYETLTRIEMMKLMGLIKEEKEKKGTDMFEEIVYGHTKKHNEEFK